MTDNLIVFPHCPKTGGTTLKERYMYDNEGFVITDLGEQVTKNTQVVFGHSSQIGYYESQFPNKNIVYMTCLRDPIDRMMSMYNFFKTQLLYLNPNCGDIDFYFWFINKDIVRPMLVVKQYEYYMGQHVNKLLWEKNQDVLISTNDIINLHHLNTILEWNVDTQTVSIDKVKEKILISQQQHAEKNNMNATWDRVIKDFDHIFFQDDNIVSVFDDLLNQYNLDMIPRKEMIRTNETSYDLKKNNLEYIKFTDLDSHLQSIVKEDLKYDIEFYDRCKDKWKC